MTDANLTRACGIGFYRMMVDATIALGVDQWHSLKRIGAEMDRLAGEEHSKTPRAEPKTNLGDQDGRSVELSNRTLI